MKSGSKKSKHIDQLTSLMEICSVVNSTLKVEEILEHIIKLACLVVKSEASSLLLLEEDKKELYFLTSIGEKSHILKSCTLKYGEGIAGWVAKTGKSCIVQNVEEDSRYYDGIDKITGYKTKSILCIPLKNKETVIGSLEVINKLNNKPFTEEDEILLTAFSNQASLALENAKLYRLAITDELTNLYSYRYFQDILQREKIHAVRSKSLLSLVVIDIDDFKDLNDKYGHRTGDTILKELSILLKNNVRGNDVLARYGGDEFVLLLTNVEPYIVKMIIDRLQSTINGYKLKTDQGVVRISASFGVATYPTNVKDVDKLFFAADHAMYDSKSSGKNLVTFYKETTKKNK